MNHRVNIWHAASINAETINAPSLPLEVALTTSANFPCDLELRPMTLTSKLNVYASR